MLLVARLRIKGSFNKFRVRASLFAMLIKVTQSGNRCYAQLLESFLNAEGKPRQRAVCTMGASTLAAKSRPPLCSVPKASHLRPLPFVTSVEI